MSAELEHFKRMVQGVADKPALLMDGRARLQLFTALVAALDQVEAEQGRINDAIVGLREREGR